MNTRLLSLLLMLSIFSVPIFAQCPPLGFPEPGNTCPEAPILCENLDGYCATINNNNVPQPFACCNNGWILNNDEWFAFFAGTTTISIEIVPQNCSDDGGLLGLQGGIYDACPMDGCNAMDVQCECVEDPFILTASNYVVGQVYWIVLDGCNGNVCDYTVNVLEGSTIGFAPENPGAITGPSTVCNGVSTDYSVGFTNGASLYHWTLMPADAGILNINGDSVTVSWADTFSGTAKLCVSTSNQCYVNPNESCIDIEILSDITRSENFSFCPGESVTINGQVYSQSGTIVDTLPSINDCDTIVTYTLTLLPYLTGAESISFCPGESVILGGQVYNQSGTVVDTLPALTGCDTIVTYTLTLLPYPTRTESISLCPGETVSIGGQVYNQSGTVVDTLPVLTGCDTIVTYTLTLLPYPTRSESISFCPDETVSLGGQVYNQSGTVADTLPALTGCDTIVTYTLTLLPYPTRAENISFCPGESVTIGGQVYNQSGTVVDTLPALLGCDTIATYTLTLLPQPTRAETISFCPGETITLGGTNYTQPGIAVLSIPSTTIGCDTIVTYTLQFLTPAPSNLNINCPNNIAVTTVNNGAVVNYSPATALSDCPCPGVAMALTSGLASGSNFPLGISSVCYTAQDSCGQSASCCFNVSVEEDDEPCDTKVGGCLKYELLSITEDLGKNRTYRIRLTNNCTNKLLYTAFQVPNGMIALEPANLSTYTAPSGNTYLVRNPNLTPQNSIRFSSISDSISSGESDIFKYTLPAQANVTFIHGTSRLMPNLYLETHLNTFYCPIGVTPNGNRSDGDRSEEPGLEHYVDPKIYLFPNPASHQVRVETGGQVGEILLQDAMGRTVLRQATENSVADFSVAGLPQGLYQVIFVGEKTVLYGSLMVQR